MELLTTLLIIFGSILLYLFYKSTKVPKGFPPGPPFKLLVVGHMHYFLTDILKAHINAGKKYGDIVGVYLGAYPNVILHDPALVREAFSNPKISGRPDMPVMNEAVDGKNGIIAADGKIWTEQRRFTIRHLRDFGFAKASMEDLIHEEIEEFLLSLSKETGKPIDLKHRFGIVVLNSVWRLVTGERVSHTDPKLNKLLEKLNEGFQETAGGALSFFVPWLAKTFPKLTGYEKFKKASKAPFPFYEEQINHHKKTFHIGQRRDLIDAYLQEVQDTTDPDSSFFEQNYDKHLIAVVNDLFLGGSETTSITMVWLILYLITHPEVQEKIFKEIQEVIGTSKLPSLADRPKMSYTEAVINETLRHSSILPFGIFHEVTDDMEFHGYSFKKYTSVNAFTYGIHHNPKIWGDPENFRPERFLDSNGVFTKNDALIPFSIGKRSCPGESFAKDQLFLFVASIFQRFHITTNPLEPYPSTEPVLSMLLVPKPYTAIINERT